MQPAQSDTKRRHREAASAAMKREAEWRKCPACKRRNAIKRTVDGDFVLRVCRWCEFEEGHYIR